MVSLVGHRNLCAMADSSGRNSHGTFVGIGRDAFLVLGFLGRYERTLGRFPDVQPVFHGGASPYVAFVLGYVWQGALVLWLYLRGLLAVFRQLEAVCHPPYHDELPVAFVCRPACGSSPQSFHRQCGAGALLHDLLLSGVCGHRQYASSRFGAIRHFGISCEVARGWQALVVVGFVCLGHSYLMPACLGDRTVACNPS